ncbi:MAG: methylated-DNA--[protein]-cysteine S-methyltransferase, partial [Acidimicrobiales bacterium]
AFDLAGLTPFEQDVLAVAQRIPAGETRPYRWVAVQIGRPAAVRAVGTALGHNPVPLLIPCHRVTRSDGTTGHYAFGPAMKESLLRAEQVNLDEVRDLARARVFYLAGTDTGVLCFPTCRNARRLEPEHRQGFRTLDEAVGQGYRPCPHCQPAAG